MWKTVWHPLFLLITDHSWANVIYQQAIINVWGYMKFEFLGNRCICFVAGGKGVWSMEHWEWRENVGYKTWQGVTYKFNNDYLCSWQGVGKNSTINFLASWQLYCMQFFVILSLFCYYPNSMYLHEKVSFLSFPYLGLLLLDFKGNQMIPIGRIMILSELIMLLKSSGQKHSNTSPFETLWQIRFFLGLLFFPFILKASFYTSRRFQENLKFHEQKRDNLR